MDGFRQFNVFVLLLKFIYFCSSHFQLDNGYPKVETVTPFLLPYGNSQTPEISTLYIIRTYN